MNKYRKSKWIKPDIIEYSLGIQSQYYDQYESKNIPPDNT